LSSLALSDTHIDQLQSKRINAISYIGITTGEYLDVIYKKLTLCKAPERLSNCDSLLLGSLLRLLLESVLQLIPKKPYGSISVNRLLGEVGIKKPGIIGFDDHTDCKTATIGLQMKLSDVLEKYVAAMDHEVSYMLSAVYHEVVTKCESKASDAPITSQGFQAPGGVPAGSSSHPPMMSRITNLLGQMTVSPLETTSSTEKVAAVGRVNITEEVNHVFSGNLKVTSNEGNPGPSTSVGQPKFVERPQATDENKAAKEIELTKEVIRSKSVENQSTKQNTNNEKAEPVIAPETAVKDVNINKPSEQADANSMKNPSEMAKDKPTGEARSVEGMIVEAYIKETDKPEEIKPVEGTNTMGIQPTEDTSTSEMKPVEIVDPVSEIKSMEVPPRETQPSEEITGTEKAKLAEVIQMEKIVKHPFGTLSAQEVGSSEQAKAMDEAVPARNAKAANKTVMQEVKPIETKPVKDAAPAQPAQFQATEVVLSTVDVQTRVETGGTGGIGPKEVGKVGTFSVDRVGSINGSRIQKVGVGHLRPSRYFPKEDGCLNPLASPFEVRPNASPSPQPKQHEAKANTPPHKRILAQKANVQNGENPKTKLNQNSDASVGPSPAAPTLQRSGNWTSDQRMQIMINLMNPATKNVIKHLRNKYRMVDARVILDIVHQKNWDLKSAEQSIVELLAKK
jgi:hypothetical protein